MAKLNHWCFCFVCYFACLLYLSQQQHEYLPATAVKGVIIIIFFVRVNGIVFDTSKS